LDQEITEKIQLPVINTEQQKAGTEEIEVEPLGDRHYRLIHSPGYVEGLAAGDEIVLVDEAVGFRVLKRSGNLCLWMIFASAKDLFSAAALTLKERVERLGGRLDGGTERTLIFTIPLKAG
jgi:hypothetical protein